MRTISQGRFCFKVVIAVEGDSIVRPLGSGPIKNHVNVLQLLLITILIYLFIFVLVNNSGVRWGT